LLKLALGGYLFVLLLTFFLCGKKSTAGAYGVHEFWLEKVVKGIHLKASVQQFQVHFICQTHQTNSFILDLSHKRSVFFVLGSNKLSNKVLAISFGNSF
jgi:hypothetical protein